MKSNFENGNEVRLIDIVRILWKWKNVIFIGVALFGLTAGIGSYISWKKKPQFYITTTMVKPGIMTIDEQGKEQYIDSLDNMKLYIEGELKHKVFSELEDTETAPIAVSEKLNIKIQRQSQLIEVSCISLNAERSSVIINQLLKQLEKKYLTIHQSVQEKLLAEQRDQIEEQQNIVDDIALNNIKLGNEHSIILSRIKQVQLQIKELNVIMDKLKRIDNLVPEKIKTNDINSTLLYLHIRQQNSDYENQYRKELYVLLKEKEDIAYRLKKGERSIVLMQQKISNMQQSELEPLNYTNLNGEAETLAGKKIQKVKLYENTINIIKQPKTEPIERKNTIPIIITLSIIVGFIIFSVAVFFIEYIRQYRKDSNSS